MTSGPVFEILRLKRFSSRGGMAAKAFEGRGMVKDIMLRKSSRLDLDRLAGEYAEEFLRNAAFVNLSRARMFSVILVILQIPLIYIDIQNRQRGLWTSVPGYFYLFIMHIAIGVAFSLFYILASIGKPGSPSDITSWHKAVGSMFPVLGMLVAIAISIVGQMIHGQITVYVIAAFWVTVGLYIGNTGALALYIGSYLFFALGIHQVQHDPRLLMANMINSGVLTVLAFLLSRVLYRAEAREFAGNKILEKRKEILQVEKSLLEEAASKAVASLRESEARFRTLAETSSAAIFIHQGNSLIYLNAAARTIAGYTKEELQRINFWNIIHPKIGS